MSGRGWNTLWRTIKPGTPRCSQVSLPEKWRQFLHCTCAGRFLDLFWKAIFGTNGVWAAATLPSNHLRRKMAQWGRHQPGALMAKVQISFFTTCSQRASDLIAIATFMQLHLKVFFHTTLVKNLLHLFVLALFVLWFFAGTNWGCWHCQTPKTNVKLKAMMMSLASQ